MPRKKSELTELGAVRTHKHEFRAHLSFLDQGGTQKDILGPSRATEEEAQEDLKQIRKPGAVGKDREEGLKIMAAEAQRIKITAKYQSQI